MAEDFQVSREARVRKNRHCTTCDRAVYGSARDLRDHDALHRFVTRTGLTLPDTSLDVTGGLVVVPNQKGVSRDGNQSR